MPFKQERDRIPASSLAALFLLIIFILSATCSSPISLQIAPTPSVAPPLRPEDFLSLLPLLEEGQTGQSGDARQSQNLGELASALADSCRGASLEAEEKMQRLMQESQSELLRSQVFFLLMRSYQHRGSRAEMKRLVEAQSDSVKRLYADDLVLWSLPEREEIDFPEQRTDLPLIVKNGLPFVRVSINGKQGDFLVDTGASKSTIVASFAEACGVDPLSSKMVRMPAHWFQKIKAGLAVLSELKIGPICLTHYPAIVIPVIIVRYLPYSFHMPKFDGTLGWDVLHRFRLKVDFKRSTISFSKPVKEEAGHRNFFWLGYPLIRLKTESGLDVYLELDTGAHHTLLNDNLEKMGVLKAVGVKLADLWGRADKNLWPASRLNLVLDGLFLRFQKPYLKRNLHISDLVRIDGLLGCDVLRLRAFVVDELNGVFKFL